MELVPAVLTSSPARLSKDVQQSFEWPLDLITGKTLTVEGIATPKTFRLIDCRAYCDENILRIIEWHSIDIIQTIAYAAISYVWKGNHQSQVSNSFAVEGATDGDRVDLDVLRVACKIAVKGEAPYLWLDRICIIQTKKDDKNWQIQRMADVYKGCSTCLVLPGGIGGLVEEGDITSWIQRSWTLQEALLPRNVQCIIKWTRGPGLMNGGIITLPVGSHENYAALPLEFLIQFTISNRIGFISLPDPAPIPPTKMNTGRPEWETVLFKNVFSETAYAPLTLNNALRRNDKDETESTIWHCAVMRTSTRSIDVVFSIMGLFGVRLDPSKYATPSEALLSLLQKSMANGDRANWLATSLTSSSIMPRFPVSTSASDTKLTETPTENLVWYLSGAPRGSLDMTGALKIVAPLSPVEVDQVVKSMGSGLGFESDATLNVCGDGRSGGISMSGVTGTHAVKLGKITLYSTAAVSRFAYVKDTLVMLLDRMDDRWCKKGMAAVPSKLTDGWEEQELIIYGKDSTDYPDSIGRDPKPPTTFKP